MAFMGYETPVAMPSMGIYNTDLMKMYIAGVKDQYEKSQEEMKDFMKLYGDFYSPIAGDTQMYNDMTIGGARRMIDQMLANGIDPYKSPEARAAISRYIASIPTGTLNAMKQNAENRKAYDQAVAQARLSGKYDPEYEAWALKQAGLDNFRTIGPNGEVRVWDRLAPDPKQDWADIAAPYLKEFEKTEMLKSDVPGYDKMGVSDENQRKGVDAVMNAVGSTPWLQYKLEKAYDSTAGMTDETGVPLSEGQRRALANQMVRKEAENTAAQYYQSKYVENPFAKRKYDADQSIRVHEANNASDFRWKKKEMTELGIKPKGGNNSKIEEKYLPLHENTKKGLKMITNGGKTSFKASQKSKLANALSSKHRESADETLSRFVISNDKNTYATWSGKKPYKDTNSMIYYDSGDENNLYSGQEVLNMMDPYHYHGIGEQGERVRAKLASMGDNGEDASIQDTGDVIAVMNYYDGLIYTFKKVRTIKNYMYEPTGYVYNANGTLDEDASGGAIDRDFKVGQVHYKGKNPMNKK